MTDTKLQSKIQKLELDTIRVVTELQKDVQNLTKEVANLAEQVQKMSENYVTVIRHTEDIAELRKDIVIVQKSGNVKAILFGVLTAVIAALLTMEIAKIIK